MPKKNLHPKWFPNAKVIVNGQEVMTVGSTKQELRVEVWSGNHPFFTGEMRIMDSEGQVDRFYKRLQARQDYLDDKKARTESRISPTRSIAELEIGKRTIETLEKAGITNVGQFIEKLSLGDEAVLAIEGFGQKSLADMKKRLRQLGYKLPANA